MLEQKERLDHHLDRLEERLPAVAAAGIRLQRAILSRACSTVGAISGLWRSSAGSIVDDARREVTSTARATADHVGDVASDAARAADAAAVAAHPDQTLSGVAYEDLTKAELYDRAARLEVEGRSTMSKSQLIEALVSAEREAVDA